MPKTSQTTVQLRRSPRLMAFLVTFAAIGLIFTLTLGLILGVAAGFIGFLIAFGTAVITILGWVTYLIVDAIFARRSRTVAATKIEG